MNPDFLVIGAGVAGLRAAIELAEAGRVLVVAKDSLRESSSEYAQGGIAVALSDDDEVELHEQDTLAAGDGLCDRAAVRTLVEEGPAAIEQLIEWGAEFDRDGTSLAFTREGAHSRNRILHAHGDSTGREIARTLYAKAASLPNIAFRSFARDHGPARGRRRGAARCLRRRHPREDAVRARAVLLATGGLGPRLPGTPPIPTWPPAMAWRMAYRAGAEISDIEFVQFHPTALHARGRAAISCSRKRCAARAPVLRNASASVHERYPRTNWRRATWFARHRLPRCGAPARRTCCWT